MKAPLNPQDLESFRKSIGLTAIIVGADGAYEFDDDVDNVNAETAIATIAIELSIVEREVMIVESKYRAWKAVMTNDILVKDPKLAEWKVRARLESEPTFIQTKEVLANLAMVREALSGWKSSALSSL